MKSAQLCLAAAMIAAGLCRSALADDAVKPIAQIDNKAIEGSIVIDAPLKAYPALYADLARAGKRELAKWAAEAANERKAHPDEFNDDRRWSFDRSYNLRSAIGRYVSVVRGDETYGGGAHPNHVIDTLFWDTQANRFINIAPFLNETKENGPALTALAKAIRAALAVEKKARDITVADPDTDPELASVKPKLTAIGGIALAPSTEKDKSSGFSVYFSPYAVGAYVEGPYTVFIPWTAFRAHLSAEGVRLFGGERPPDDEKNE